MVLESTVICIDNGEYMRNGDFMPTRMQAQQEAANVLIQCKLRSNAENNVALLTMAPRANMQVGLTHETNKLMAKLHQIQPNGLSSFMFGIQVAQLALKHRPNRTSQSRIVAFVGSPVEESEEQLIRLAKQLKKSRYYVDVVLFGEVNDNQAKLQSFISTLNGTEDNSHIIVVPPGSNLSETLVQSTIIQGESTETAAMAAMAGGAGGFDFGMDGNDDPELALALRVSLEEERQRAQQQAMREGATAAAPAADAAATTPAPTPVAQAPAEPNFASMTEEELVEYAMQLSMAQEAAAAAASKPTGSSAPEPMDVSAPSSSTTKPNAVGQEAATISQQDNIEKIISDPEALEALIGTLPGVDPKSEAFKKAKEEKEKEKCKNEEKK